MVYKYIALNSNGVEIKGRKEANSPSDLRKILKKENIELLRIISKNSPAFLLKKNLFEKVTTKDISILTRELSTMVGADLGIIRSLEILEFQLKKDKLKNILINIKKDVTSGEPLAMALSKYPQYFDSLYISMVKVGENSGKLDVIFLRISETLEKKEEIKGKVISAIIYPFIIFMTTMLVIFFMLTFVIPKFTLLFEGANIEMPLLTQIVINISDIMSKYWYLFLFGITLVIVSFKAGIKRKNIRESTDKIVLKIPIIGKFIRKTEMARFTRTMSTLLKSGVSIIEAFDITSEVITNSIIKKVILEAKLSIRDGASIHKPLADSGEFPIMVTDMIEVGEESGTLPLILEKIADFLEIELDESVRNILAGLEPAIILFMAVGVGILIISMFLPLFEISEIVG